MQVQTEEGYLGYVIAGSLTGGSVTVQVPGFDQPLTVPADKVHPRMSAEDMEDGLRELGVMSFAKQPKSIRLTVLPWSLLGALWPPECIVKGIMTCKRARMELAGYVQDVNLTTTRVFSAVCLRPFYSSRIHLKWKGDLPALVKLCSSDDAFSAALVSLDLTEVLERVLSASEPLGLSLSHGLSRFTSLTKLNVQKLNVEGPVLAEGLRGCTSLVHLSCANTMLDPAGLAVLAPVLARNTNLQHLDLNCSEALLPGASSTLSTILATCTKLSHLDLGQNVYCMGRAGLAALVPSLEGLTSLDLGGNYLEEEEGAALSRLLHAATRLRCLRLSTNSLGNLKAAVPLARALGSPACGGLTELCLSDNGIGAEGAASLAEALRGLPGLTALDLFQNPFGAEGVGHVAEVLSLLGQLRLLDLGSTFGKAEGMRALGAAMGAGQCSALTELRLQQSGLEGEEAGPGAGALGAGIRCARRLETLNLNYNDLGAAGVAALAPGLGQCLRLRHLYMNGQLGAGGAEALEGAVQGPGLLLKTLEVCGAYCGAGAARLAAAWLVDLNLGGNELGAEGARELGVRLRECSALTRLQACNNGAGGEGFALIMEGVAAAQRRGGKLRVLDLSHNEVRAEGVRQGVRALGCCTALQELKLSFNQLGSDGACVLAEALAQCGDLREVDLGNNEVDDVGATAVARGLAPCSRLERLWMPSSITEAGRSALQALMDRHRARGFF